MASSVCSWPLALGSCGLWHGPAMAWRGHEHTAVQASVREFCSSLKGLEIFVRMPFYPQSQAITGRRDAHLHRTLSAGTLAPRQGHGHLTWLSWELLHRGSSPRICDLKRGIKDRTGSQRIAMYPRRVLDWSHKRLGFKSSI